MRIKFYSCFIALFLLCFVKSFSQTSYSGLWGTLTERPNTPINEMINGYIEVLPPGYDPNGSTRYPLLIFLEGQSQFGNGSPTELQNLYGQNEGMLPDIIRNNHFDNSYDVSGTTYHFIVIIPQVRKQVQTGRPSPERMASPTEVNDVINFALQNYKVDVNRVYLSGLSLGGGSTWNYAGYSKDYADRLAAIVPFAGASNLWDNHARVTNIAASNLPVWTFVSAGDDPYDTLAQRYIDSLDTHSEYTAERLITVFPAGDHNSWGRVLDEHSVGATTGNGTYPSVYKWMLSKSRPTLTQPTFATVNAGSDQTLNLPNGSMVVGTNGVSFTGATITLSGSVSGAVSPTYEWRMVDGNGGSILSPNSLTTDVTNLKPGSYTYQLRVTENGVTAVDNVTIQVNRPPENKYYKVEAEQNSGVNPPRPTFGNPLLDQSILDEGSSYGLNNMRPGNWAQYDLSTLGLLPGTYSLYIRYSSPVGNPGVQVTVDNATTYSTTLTSFPYYPSPLPTWHTSSPIEISLASNSVIKFESLGDEWVFNYFELVQTSSALPVRFVSFSAECRAEGGVSLQWKTGGELNAQRFSVERSTDGIKWSEVGSVAAAGRSSTERSYVFLDKGGQEASLYRIMEYDYDGKQTVSSIIRSHCLSAKEVINLYPNPTSVGTTLSLTLQRDAPVTIEVLDTRGAVLQKRQVVLPKGTSSLALNLEGLAKGVYNIQVHYNGERKSLKLIKK